MNTLIALFVVAVVILLEGFGIWMLLGIDQREPTSRGRLCWLCIITATQWLGGLAYCLYRTLRPLDRRPLSSPRGPRVQHGIRPHAGGA